ncbi:MAG: DUF4825 domain-containing protein [Bacilli bacterium]
MIAIIGIFNFIGLSLSGGFDKKSYILLIITPLFSSIVIFAICLFLLTFTHKTKKIYTEDTVPITPFNRDKSEIDSIIKYKNKYVGNNSNDDNLINNLPLSEYGYVFEIDSVNLGLTIDYHNQKQIKGLYPNYNDIISNGINKDNFNNYLENKMNNNDFVENIFDKIFVN